MFVAPIKIQLNLWEIRVIDRELSFCVNAVLNPKADIPRIETVVMAEYAPAWARQTQGYRLDPERDLKKRKFRLPLSIARIIWNRLQYRPATTENQSVLTKLDQPIVNIAKFTKELPLLYEIQPR